MKRARVTPTLADVAAAADVAPITVSRVLNDQPSVSNKTRDKVRKAVVELGYHPNLAARALVTGSTQTVGVMVARANLSGPSGALLGIEQMARARGYWVTMAGLQSDEPDEARQAITHFIRQGVDGVIAVAQTQIAVDATLKTAGHMPTVLVSSGRIVAERSVVDIDQEDGANQVMTLLRGLGHTRIAHITGPAGDLHAEAREAVWRASLPPNQDADGLRLRGDWSAASGYRAAMSMLAMDEPPTAVFAGNDRTAFGVIRAINERGFRIPSHMSVVGFDDIDGADYTSPPLTTIRQDHIALGMTAMELLLEAIADRPIRRVKIPPQLIVRASTGVARRGPLPATD